MKITRLFSRRHRAGDPLAFETNRMKTFLLLVGIFMYGASCHAESFDCHQNESLNACFERFRQASRNVAPNASSLTLKIIEKISENRDIQSIRSTTPRGEWRETYLGFLDINRSDITSGSPYYMLRYTLQFLLGELPNEAALGTLRQVIFVWDGLAPARWVTDYLRMNQQNCNEIAKFERALRSPILESVQNSQTLSEARTLISTQTHNCGIQQGSPESSKGSAEL